MKKIMLIVYIGLIVLAVLIAAAFLAVIGKEILFEGGQVKKPAIYLYPTEDSNISVSLYVNGEITVTEPHYGQGWNVFVTEEGIIDGKYDYLFYEADLDYILLPNEGWVVQYSELVPWFEENLVVLGLNEKEQMQFMQYWLKELPYSEYYEIRLLDDEFLKKNMGLVVAPVPDTTIRLNFYFKPLSEKIRMDSPMIITPKRVGFTVVEWGGLVDT